MSPNLSHASTLDKKERGWMMEKRQTERNGENREEREVEEEEEKGNEAEQKKGKNACAGHRVPLRC